MASIESKLKLYEIKMLEKLQQVTFYVELVIVYLNCL